MESVKASAAKTLPFILFALALLALSGCTAAALTSDTAVMLGGEAVGIVATRPGTPPPPDLADSIPEHESWCYETLGYPECYAHPQDTVANRLINVDPANRYPLTPRAYDAAVIEDR